jgi:GPH family glycoside/pentoside/hexuronide:cation symporter
MQSGKLSVKTKLLFSTGDLSSTLTLAVQTFFQMYFLTDIARLSPGTVGWIIGLTRLWDAVNDPLVGMWSDRLKSQHGRRRLLLAYGSFPLGLTCLCCWIIPPLSQWALAIYYMLVIIAFDTAFTVVNIGYNALTPAMTSDYDERSSLNGYRMVFTLGGTLAALIFATVLSEIIEVESARFAVLGGTLGLLSIIPPWIVRSVTRDVEAVHETSRMSLRQALHTTLSNRAFLPLACMFLASWTATCVLAAMLVYYASYFLKVPEQANYFVLAAQSSAVLSVPLCVWLATKWDKPTAFLAGIGFWCVVLTVFFALSQTGVAVTYVVAILCGPGIATAAVIPWAMLPDVIEVEQEQSGERREGAYYAFISFFQKLGTGLALWGIGHLLEFSGYLTPTSEQQFPDQPASALYMIRFIIGPATIGLLLISLPFACWYPVTRASHQQTLERIKQPGKNRTLEHWEKK